MTSSEASDLLQITLLSHRLEKRLADTAGLSVNELHCLVQLYLVKPCCVRTLTGLLGIDPTSTSKLLRSLDKRGFLCRSLDEHDRRMERVSLTPSGVGLMQDVMTASTRVWEEILSQLPPERAIPFSQCVHTIASVFVAHRHIHNSTTTNN